LQKSSNKKFSQRFLGICKARKRFADTIQNSKKEASPIAGKTAFIESEDFTLISVCALRMRGRQAPAEHSGELPARAGKSFLETVLANGIYSPCIGQQGKLCSLPCLGEPACDKGGHSFGAGERQGKQGASFRAWEIAWVPRGAAVRCDKPEESPGGKLHERGNDCKTQGKQTVKRKKMKNRTANGPDDNKTGETYGKNLH
jgi:hypothetical protein